MRFGKIILLSAFICVSVAKAQDVIVDLSVLDELETSQVGVSKPLFPVLPKKAKVDVKKNIVKSMPKVTIKHKNNNAKRGVEKVKPIDDSIVVVDVEPVSTPKAPVSSKETVTQNFKNTIEEKIVTEDVVKEKTVAVPSNTEVKKDVVLTIPSEKILQQVKKEKSINTTNENIALENKTTEVEDANTEDLIIKESVSDNKIESYIKFEDNVDELNDTQKLKIDTIVSKYKNAPKNKIAIYSYNFDNGIDSFKRKRISLNRAVEIRSYLLKKGYKNFSIKVININSSSDKINVVELQEI